LVDAIIVAIDYDWLSFSIFVSADIENFSILNVHELPSLESKDLPPVGVCAPDSHVSVSTVVFNVKGLVVVSGSNCQRLLMEIPDLRVSSVWSLDNHVSVVNKIKVSILLHL
jgi:hypothetical protein